MGSLIMDHNKGFWGKTWKKFTFVNLYFVLGTGVNSWREWLPAWSFSSFCLLALRVLWTFCLLALRVLWTCEPPLVRRKDSERQKQWEGRLRMLMEGIQTTTKVENKKWKWKIKKWKWEMKNESGKKVKSAVGSEPKVRPRNRRNTDDNIWKIHFARFEKHTFGIWEIQ